MKLFEICNGPKKLKENIEDRHAELIMTFDELSKKHKKNPEYSSIKKQFEEGKVKFSRGYETEYDDLMDDGFDEMEQAVEKLKKLK